MNQAYQGGLWARDPANLTEDAYTLLSAQQGRVVLMAGLDANHQAILLAELARGQWRTPAAFGRRVAALAQAQAQTAADGGQLGLFLGL